MFENYEKDYIMRQIKMLGQLLARLLLRSDGVKYELPLKAPYSKADELHQALCRLLAEGKINEAENWLYEEVGQLGLPGLRVAIDFYLQLTERDDAYLEAHNFTRAEIEDGLKNIAQQYGVVL